MIEDFKDIYIRWQEHPNYNPNQVIEDEIINVVVQKLEMILFSKKGEVFGNEDMGCDIEYYLWSTSMPSTNIQKIISDQIDIFIPELNTLGYTLKIDLYQGIQQDTMVINITIKGYNINFLFE